MLKRLGTCKRLCLCNVENVTNEKTQRLCNCYSKQYTVKQFVNIVCKELGMKISWTGKLNKEKAFWKNKPIIEVDKKYFRPTEVNSLKGNYSLARKELGWKPKIQIRNLVKEMITEELKNYSK